MGRLESAWAAVGIAIRTAQSLMLHLRTGGQQIKDRRLKELGGKFWHSSVTLERMIALQVGVLPRTASTPSTIPFHLDADYVDSILGTVFEHGQERPSVVEFQAAYSRLYSHVMVVENDFRVGPGGCTYKMFACDTNKLLNVDALLQD